MFVVALVAAAVLAGCSGEGEADYRTYVVRPAINNNAILDGEPLPAECRDENVMKVLCARGEYEPASFLVQTDKPLEQVMVKVGPLTGSAGVLAPETVDVRIAKKLLVSPCFGKVAIPFALVHDPGMWKTIDKPPKWLLEFEGELVNGVRMTGGRRLDEYKAKMAKMNMLLKPLVDTKQLQPADIDGRRQFWLTIHVPDNAASGTYRAQVTISAKNAPATKLTLEVTVPEFDLLPPKFEYSIFYPVHGPLTDEQSLVELELRNMIAHGCTNPTIYGGPARRSDSDDTMDYSDFEKMLELRRKAGIPQGGLLYILGHPGEPVARPLSAQERQQAVREVREAVAWARARGYSDVYFKGLEDASGERLRAERDSFESIHKGGGKIFVSCETDFFDIIGDLLDRPVLRHPGAHIVDQHQQWQVDTRDFLLHRQRMVTYDPELMMTPHIQKMIKGVHKNGFKIFARMDPAPGNPLPQLHRRNRGLGLWKTGLDGTMTRAYFNHYAPRPIRFDDQQIKDNGVDVGAFDFVLRGPEGPLDTLAWEGYREGYDDARYLATLQDAIAKAKAAGKHARLLARTERWLGDITVNADLDEWRAEMARRIEVLLQP